MIKVETISFKKGVTLLLILACTFTSFNPLFADGNSLYQKIKNKRCLLLTLAASGAIGIGVWQILPESDRTKIKKLEPIAEDFQCSKEDFRKVKEILESLYTDRVPDFLGSRAAFDVISQLNRKIEKSCPRSLQVACFGNVIPVSRGGSARLGGINPVTIESGPITGFGIYPVVDCSGEKAFTFGLREARDVRFPRLEYLQEKIRCFDALL